MVKTISDEDVVQTTQRIRRCFGHFRHVKTIYARLDALRTYVCTVEEPESIAILGVSGMGKSSLLTNYLKQHPPKVHDVYTEVPVLYAEVPPNCTIKKLATILLRAINSPFPITGDEEDRTHQLVTLIRECKVRLIIIDEVNHLVRGGQKTRYLVGDWIKQLITKTRVPVVLAGTPIVRDLMRTNEQMTSRFAETISIHPFSVGENSNNPIGFALSVFKSVLKDYPCIDLLALEHESMFAFATGGRLRSMCHLFVRAVEIGAKCGGVTHKSLGEAFPAVIYDKCPQGRNPFLKDFNGIPLSKLNEPFYIDNLEAL